MSSYLKTQDWEKSYSKYRKALYNISIPDLEILLEWYMLADSGFSFQIQALRDELEFRNSSLGGELS